MAERDPVHRVVVVSVYAYVCISVNLVFSTKTYYMYLYVMFFHHQEVYLHMYIYRESSLLKIKSSSFSVRCVEMHNRLDKTWTRRSPDTSSHCSRPTASH